MKSICVVTVTYGNRWKLLKQVLERLISLPEVSSIIIVDNASEYKVSEAVAKLNDKRIRVFTNKENQGSSGGYKEGITKAADLSEADFIWLLDDDNLPKVDAAKKLLSAWEEIEGEADTKSLFCFRADRLTHLRIAKGQDPRDYYLVPNNFMGFHLFRILKNKLRKAKYPEIDRQPIRPYIRMPYVPYGGFMFHKDLIKKIGTPNPDFFVYVDDSDYTYRVTRQGGQIWLVSEAEIYDIDPSQGNNYKTSILRSPLLDLWNFRTFYQVRNRIYFYSRVSVKNRFVYNLNQFLFMTHLYFIALISGKMREYRGLKSAVKQGHMGQLGKVHFIPGSE